MKTKCLSGRRLASSSMLLVMSASVNASKTGKYVFSGGEVAGNLNHSCAVKAAVFRHSALLAGDWWGDQERPRLFTLKLFCGSVPRHVFKLTDFKNLQLFDQGNVLNFYGVAVGLAD